MSVPRTSHHTDAASESAEHVHEASGRPQVTSMSAVGASGVVAISPKACVVCVWVMGK